MPGTALHIHMCNAVPGIKFRIHKVTKLGPILGITIPLEMSESIISTHLLTCTLLLSTTKSNFLLPL